jgi:hypothetical protein
VKTQPASRLGWDISARRVVISGLDYDKEVYLSEVELLAPMHTREHLNLSVDASVRQFRRRRGLDEMTGEKL